MNSPIRTIFFLSCSLCFAHCKHLIPKSEFIASYQLAEMVPLDHSGKTTEQTARPQDWRISLEEKNNFILERSGNKVYGYWEVIESESGKFAVILHTSGSSYPARIDRKAIYFDSPSGLLDSLFLQARFERRGRE